MGSDNGKPGRVDMYDVWSAVQYIEEHYQGTVQLLMERSVIEKRSFVLCSLTFVSNDGRPGRGVGILCEIPDQLPKLLCLPELLHNAVLVLHEELDSLQPGTMLGKVLRY